MIMPDLKDLAAEYLENAKQMEARIQQLESQLKHTRRLESQRKLRKRINALHVMVCESRRTAFQLEHYYDKPKEMNDENKQQPKRKRGRPRKQYSNTGYGVAAPAALEHGTGADAEAVSGICAAFLGWSSTEGDSR